jgi:hypothetical protein
MDPDWAAEGGRGRLRYEPRATRALFGAMATPTRRVPSLRWRSAPRTGSCLVRAGIDHLPEGAGGRGRRPWPGPMVQRARSRSQVPSRVERRKCLWVADQEAAPIVEQHPSGAAEAVDVQDRGDVLVPTPCRGHGRPLLGWGWISRWEALPCGVGQMRGSAGAAALLRNSNVVPDCRVRRVRSWAPCVTPPSGSRSLPPPRRW